MTDEQDKIDSATFKRELTLLIPHLRAFARSLCRDASLADDLAQDAMLKAWNARESFHPGTNMKAWAFTILRNAFYSEKRRSWRRQPLDPEVAEATLVSNSNPADALELLALSYEEAAEVCNCAVGTIKSRVSRARKAVIEILETNETGYNTDPKMSAGQAFDDIMKQADEIAGASSV